MPLFNPCMRFEFFLDQMTLKSGKEYSLGFYTESASPPIYLHLIFPILQFEMSSWIFFQFWTGFFACEIQVWNIKLAKSKILVRIVKNVISKWTKMDYLMFSSFWFIAVTEVNPPDRKLVMYNSVNCRKGVNS